jgi:hypothetical protein
MRDQGRGAARTRFTGDFLPSCAAPLASSWRKHRTTELLPIPIFVSSTQVGCLDTAR